MEHLKCLPLLGVITIAASLAACATIPSGRTGVEWSPMNGTMNRPLAEGLSFVLAVRPGLPGRSA